MSSEVTFAEVKQSYRELPVHGKMLFWSLAFLATALMFNLVISGILLLRWLF